MNINQAKQVAWIEAGRSSQEMYVVERSGKYFAASRLDLQRQFAGLSPIYTVKARGRKAGA